MSALFVVCADAVSVSSGVLWVARRLGRGRDKLQSGSWDCNVACLNLGGLERFTWHVDTESLCESIVFKYPIVSLFGDRVFDS